MLGGLAMGISKKKSDGRSRHRHHDDSDEDHRESKKLKNIYQF